MDPSDHPAPTRPTWSASRPSRPSEGPPGLAALLDAERSALRDHHERLAALDAAQREVAGRQEDVAAAVRRQEDARHRSPGMRDRLRTSAHDSRLLLADVRSAASAATAGEEACRLRVLASQQRLDEVRQIVDGVAAGDPALLTGIRRLSTLPAAATVFPTVAAFVADEPGRAAGDPRQQDLIGRGIGERWTLEEAGRPWVTTRWQARWSCDGDLPRSEVFAVEQAARPRAARRVILLGLAAFTPALAHEIERLTGRQSDRNSLAALAAAVAAA